VGFLTQLTKAYKDEKQGYNNIEAKQLVAIQLNLKSRISRSKKKDAHSKHLGTNVGEFRKTSRQLS
jgi:hypothetical protein